MRCETVKPGIECMFMKKGGCAYNGGSCHPVVEQCQGCERAKEFPAGVYCTVFPDPRAKWSNGSGCSMATHLKKMQTVAPPARKVNPLKASKRSSTGR